MNARNTILFLMPTVFLMCLVWALKLLVSSHSLWGFFNLCGVNFAIMYLVWLLDDRFQDQSPE
jgi:bacteriorhodopsin